MKKLAVVLFLAVGSCAHLPPPVTFLDCAEQAVQTQLPSLATQVESILTSGSLNQQAALGALLSAAGSAVICAVEAVVAKLEAGGASTLNPAQRNAALLQGQVFLQAHLAK